ncbi:MAG: hypothetical protein V9H26_19460 [Verrucomicrobiota bacterium]
MSLLQAEPSTGSLRLPDLGLWLDARQAQSRAEQRLHQALGRQEQLALKLSA